MYGLLGFLGVSGIPVSRTIDWDRCGLIPLGCLSRRSNAGGSGKVTVSHFLSSWTSVTFGVWAICDDFILIGKAILARKQTVWTVFGPSRKVPLSF